MGRHTREPYGRAIGQVMVEDLVVLNRNPFGLLTVLGRKISDTLHANGLVATERRLQPDYTLVQEP
ncbi:hypothetical protein GIKK_59 [Gordonia phage GiKK]|nr:hypothetical protein GIKK_59 [Gordonia phage GiKK]